MCDLALPDYMSKIVNIGIQQNGLESTVPDVIRSSEMNKLTLFMGRDTKNTVLDKYQLLDKQELSPEEYQKYQKSYPVLSSEPVYVLKKIDSSEYDGLNTLMGRPIMIVYMFESRNVPGMSEMFQDMPADADPFALLYLLPESQMEGMRQTIDKQMTDIPESIINQSAISYLSVEYRTIGLDLTAKQNAYLLKVGGIMLLLTLAGTLASITVGYYSARVAAGFARNTRRQLFHKVEYFSNSEFDKFSPASLITRTTNDIQQIQMVLVILLRIIFYAPIIGVGGAIKAMGQDMSMSWIIGAAVLVVLSMIIIVFAIAISKFRKVQILTDRLNLVTREMLTGLMVVRAFNNQEHEEKKFDEANIDLTKVNLFIQRIMIFMMPAMMLIMNGVMLMVIWFGAHQVDQGSMQVGNMMAFMQYAILIIMAFLMASMIFIMVPRASVSAQRISEVLETDPVIKNPPQERIFSGETKGLVEFKNVSFKYPGAEDYVLHDISFTSVPGKTTAICGGTGSGKSTLVNLIPRFYDVTEGKILFDNLDVREVTQHALREKIGYVPQRSVLFTGTIASNIRYADENASQQDIENAAEISQSIEFINQSENGFESPVSQSGANLSGGQKQRLSIARALARKPEVFIFDDSFSAIDFKTDATLRKALRKRIVDSTIIIVAQRIGTIMNADQIIVLDEGRIVGKGTHTELMSSCKVYQELALSQLSMEELN